MDMNFMDMEYTKVRYRGLAKNRNQMNDYLPALIYLCVL